MRVTATLPELIGSPEQMAAQAIGSVMTKVPMCKAPCECANCQTCYYTMAQQKLQKWHYTQVLSNEEATIMLNNYINTIRSARDYLSQTIQQHGDLLLDRWVKRTPNKRAVLLTETEPDLPMKKGYFADVQHTSQPMPFEEQRSSQFRKHALLPYLDVTTATGDHLWLLQTEVPYFRRYMRKLYQMQAIESVRQARTTFTVMNSEIVEEIDVHWSWRAILLELENLQGLYHRFRDSISPGHALPKKFDRSIGALEVLLVILILERSRQLAGMLSQRPGFRKNYKHEATSLNAKGAYESNFKLVRFGSNEYQTNAAVFRKERLWWILTQLQCEPDSHTRFRYDLLLDLLDDHLAKANAKERARLDEVLYEKLSDYVTLLELLWSIRMHCPRNVPRHKEDCETTEDRIFWRTSKNSQKLQNPDFSAAATALEGLHKAKSPTGVRNQKWLQQYDLVQSFHRNFWCEMESAYRGAYGSNGMSDVDIKFSMEPLRWWNDIDHVSRLGHERQKFESEIKRSEKQKNVNEFIPLPYESPSSVKLDTSFPAKAKAKDKTRGVSHAHEADETIVTSKPTKTSLDVIVLPKGPYMTLRSMFPTTLEERVHSIDWNNFVNSMNEAGFTARNGGGSIVRFENRNGEGSINFHRPHPEPTLDPIMLQAIGKRMNRWFGWAHETFALVEK